MPIYSIANWERFETAETRKLADLKWVATPNKHDGLGFRTMAMERNALELFGAWNAILQVASRGRGADRGKLLREGRPVGPKEMALMTGFPQSAFERAFDFFSGPSMGWLVRDECREFPPSTASSVLQDQSAPVSPAESPARPASPPARAGDPPAEGMEGKEGNGREGTGGAGAPSSLRFKPPSREELDLEAAKIGLPPSEVDKFVAHYGSNGWKVGKNPMKSWPHALSGWRTRWQENHDIHRNRTTADSPAARRNAVIATSPAQAAATEARIREVAGAAGRPGVEDSPHFL